MFSRIEPFVVRSNLPMKLAQSHLAALATAGSFPTVNTWSPRSWWNTVCCSTSIGATSSENLHPYAFFAAHLIGMGLSVKKRGRSGQQQG